MRECPTTSQTCARVPAHARQSGEDRPTAWNPAPNQIEGAEFEAPPLHHEHDGVYVGHGAVDLEGDECRTRRLRSPDGMPGTGGFYRVEGMRLATAAPWWR